MKRKLAHITPAMSFILLMGVISLFSDMTHESASGVRGAYLSLLGASASAIGFVSGLGELVGYSLRFVFGLITDRTKKYWDFTILGYAVDLLAVPALALVREDGWIWACALLILERTGKAIKKPAKDTIMSFAASSEGVGRSFAIQEALDQIGAFLGPLMLSAAMALRTGLSEYEGFRFGFLLLLIPALVSLGLLVYARRKYPAPEDFEKTEEEPENFRLRPSFLLYLAAIGLFAFGFLDFSLISMHVYQNGLIGAERVPLLYAGAMLADAASALFFGRMYDKAGFRALTVSTALSAPFALFVFGFRSLPLTILGAALWGVGMGAQESILKAAVSAMVPKQSRAAGYGLFECAFGCFWFLGSWLCGVLYEISLPALIAVSAGAQALAVLFYIFSASAAKKEKAA